MRSLIEQLPRTSAVARSVHGERVEWGPVEHLLAAAVDQLALANWQRTGKKQNRPKPLTRPGQRVRHRPEFTPDRIRKALAAGRG